MDKVEVDKLRSEFILSENPGEDLWEPLEVPLLKITLIFVEASFIIVAQLGDLPHVFAKQATHLYKLEQIWLSVIHFEAKVNRVLEFKRFGDPFHKQIRLYQGL